MAVQDGFGTGFLGRVEFQVKSPMQSSPIVRLIILATAIFSVLGFALSPAQAEDSAPFALHEHRASRTAFAQRGTCPFPRAFSLALTGGDYPPVMS